MGRRTKTEQEQSEMALTTPINAAQLSQQAAEQTQAAENVISVSSLESALNNCFQGEQFAKAVKNAIKPLLETIHHEVMTNRTMIKTQQIQLRNQELKIQEMEIKIREQDTKINTMKQRNDSQEKLRRLEILRVTGLPEDIKEAEEIFIHTAKEKLKVELKGPSNDNPDFTITTEKSQNRQEGTNNPQNQRSIKVVKFNNIWKRREIYTARSGLKDTDIFLNEDLDAEDRQLFYHCRQLKKKNKILATWTKELKIYVKGKDNEIHIIEDKNQLGKFNEERKIQDESDEPITESYREAFEKFFKN